VREAAIKDVDPKMRRVVQFLFAGNFLFGAIFLGGCQTMPEGIHQARIEMAQRIAAEPVGDYYIGRRYYKPDFKFWGYVRRPGQPWSAAQLVMLNEKEKLAPRAARVRERQQLRIQALRPFQWRQSLRASEQRGLSGVRFAGVRTDLH